MPTTPAWGIPYAEESEFATDFPAQVDQPRAELLDGLLSEAAASLVYLSGRDTNMVQGWAPGVKMLAGAIPAVPAIAAGATITLPATFGAGIFTSPPSIVGICGSSRIIVGVQSVDTAGAVFALSNFTPADSPGPTWLWWIACGLGAAALSKPAPPEPPPTARPHR